MRAQGNLRIGPVFKLGFVWWGKVKVSIDSFAQAKEMLIEYRATCARSTRRASTSSAKSEHLARLGSDEVSLSHVSSARQLADSESPFNKKFYTPVEVAAWLKRSAGTIRRWCQAGEIVRDGFPAPGAGAYILAARAGGEWLISEEEIYKFLGRMEGRDVQHRKRGSGAQR